MNTIAASSHFNERNYKVSWSAVFAGILIAITINFLFNFLGMGFGFTAYKADTDTLNVLGVGAIIWLIISSIIAMGIGGWAAGRFSGTHSRTEGFLHGFLTWSLASILTFIFVTSSAGAIISGTINLVGSGLSAIGSAATISRQLMPKMDETMQNLMPVLTPTLNKIKEQANTLISKNKENLNLDQAKNNLGEKITAFLEAINNEDDHIANIHEALVNTLVQTTDMDSTQAEQQVGQWQEAYLDAKEMLQQKSEDAKQQALAASEKAAALMGQIALVTFFVLLCGGIAASCAGMSGAPKRHAPIL